MSTNKITNNKPLSSGSEWRKWDLHIHTPTTKLNDGFVVPEGQDKWDIFCEKLENSDVAVFGLTDYFSIDGYNECIKCFNAKYQNSNKVFFPNLEFRIDSKNTSNEHIQIHVIFSNNEITLNKIPNFLTRLKLVSTDNTTLNNKYCTSTDLSDVGYDKAMVFVADLEKQLEDDFSDEEYLIVGVANGYGSLRPNGSTDGRGAEYAKELDKKCKMFFGAAKNTNLFLNKIEGRAQYELLPKPILFGCDAHSFDILDKKLGRAFEEKDGETVKDYSEITWIKADTTFDGLKQIIFEPEDRIKIQNTNPYADRNKIYFSSIKLSGSTNFILPDFEIPLNRELVALIGGRGTGKTALLDTFAFLNEEHVKVDQNEKSKIIEYYRNNENRSEPEPSFTLSTVIVDKDNNLSEVTKELSDYSNLELPFLYLGQEQLSGISTNDFELTRTVCQLIGIDINEIGQESLVSRAREILSDIENNEEQITDIIQRYESLGFSGKDDIEKWIQGYLQKLKDQQKRLSSKETQTILEDINTKTVREIKLKDLKESADALQLRLRQPEVNEDIGKFNIILKELYSDVDPIVLLDASQQIASIESLKEKIGADMDALRAEIVKQKQALIKQGIKEDVNSLLQASEALQKQISSVEKDLQNYNNGKLKTVTLHVERGAVLEDIKTSLEKLKNEITSSYANFEKSREDSNQEEKELFEGIIKGISVEGQIEFNQKGFIREVLENYVDNRKIPNETELRKMIAGENADGTAKDIDMENLFNWIQSDITNSKGFNKGGLIGITNFVFTKWNDFLGVRAVAKLNGKPTEILSIGQRGTLLLKVYLATSTAKQVFVIDQPEDNLDNNFIMNELVPLIRKTKKSRQIIMSTHNANLVVNADADQIIVAQLDQARKSYISGSIENTEINKNIRDILEGGEEAFRKREQKYHIK